jgi:ATP-dependent DNA helicase RecQ
MTAASPESVLKKYWGHDRFRPLQREIVQAALDRHDVLALLPTGGGKSVCFQVPGLLLDGRTWFNS